MGNFHSILWRKLLIFRNLTFHSLVFTGKAFKKAGINSVLTELKAMGHKVDSSAEKLASVNVISQKDKSITTFADERGDGGSVRF